MSESKYNEGIIMEIKINENEKISPISKEHYKTIILVSKIIAFLGWTVFCFGALALVIAILQLTENFISALGLVWALLILIGGLFLVSIGHIIRAIIKNTQNSSKILLILENKIMNNDL